MSSTWSRRSSAVGSFAERREVEPGERPLTRSLPLLALRYRKRVIPARVHRGASTALQPLFWPPVVLFVLAGLVATNVWLFGAERTALTRAARQLPFHPNLFLLVTVLVIFSGFFHELGHATATRYGGGSPGVMGVGIYLAWPAFYTDLTDSYRLNRAGRLRCDLGGVYFNAVLIVAAGAAYFTTGFGPLAVFIVVSQAMAMYQFLPFIRLDGYYIMSDLIGVPNLFAYLGPVLRSTFRRIDPVTKAQLHLLKRRARVAIKIWSVVTIVFLAFNFGGLAVMAPIILPAEWASIHLQAQSMVMAFARGNVAVGAQRSRRPGGRRHRPVGPVAHRRHLAPAGTPSHPEMVADTSQGRRRLRCPPRRGVAVPGPGFGRTTRSLPRILQAGADDGEGSTSDDALVAPVPAPASATPSSPSPAVSATPAASSPAVSDVVYVVQPGDTLWGIATHQLGNSDQWPSIFDLNAGRPQPDGRSLVDPDLIYAGWRLELPGSQSAAAVIPTPSPPVDQSDAVLSRLSPPPPDEPGSAKAAPAARLRRRPPLLPPARSTRPARRPAERSNQGPTA